VAVGTFARVVEISATSDKSFADTVGMRYPVPCGRMTRSRGRALKEEDGICQRRE
jgi:hypothetical protein